MTVPDVSYITGEEVTANTLLTGLAALSEPNREILIAIAEDQIDSYVGPQPHHYADTNIDRVFPRSEDFYRVGTGDGIEEYPDTPEIPYQVSRACLRQVEYLYTNYWDNRTSSLLPIKRELSSVSIGGDGSYSATRARGGTQDGEEELCEAARKLLKGFVSRTCGIDVTDPDLCTSPT